MKIKEFIEKAIEGGYLNSTPPSEQKPSGKWYFFDIEEDLICKKSLEEILLDPKAWEAVGKVEGWSYNNIPSEYHNFNNIDEWKYRMHQMIDHLIEGKSLESYIETL